MSKYILTGEVNTEANKSTHDDNGNRRAQNNETSNGVALRVR